MKSIMTHACDMFFLTQNYLLPTIAHQIQFTYTLSLLYAGAYDTLIRPANDIMIIIGC